MERETMVRRARGGLALAVVVVVVAVLSAETIHRAQTRLSEAVRSYKLRLADQWILEDLEARGLKPQLGQVKKIADAREEDVVAMLFHTNLQLDECKGLTEGIKSMLQ